MVEMTRFRFGEKGESIDVHGIVDLADALMLHSRSKEDAPPVAVNRHHKRAFECKTCSRRFSSFQALGGHRTSHKKPRRSGDDRHQAQGGVIMNKSKAHECSVCGLEFALGQALGGHMRRHRAGDEQGFGRGLASKSSDGKRELWSDLNLQRSSVVDTELRLGLGY